MAESDITLPDSARTITEDPRAADATLVQPVAGGREVLGALSEFRGWKILEQLPTKIVAVKCRFC